MQHFVNNESARYISQKENLSYISVQNHYKIFRHLCATISQREYDHIRHKRCEYEEYYYVDKSKKMKREAIFDAHNFLTFDFENHIYTLLMPSLIQYKQQFIRDGMDGTYIDEFNKYKRDNKIIKVLKHENNIVKFWNHFEKSILKYKGVKSNSFEFFLKECEFKYNHTKEQAVKLLIAQHYLKKNYNFYV
jgi:transposase-like protein